MMALFEFYEQASASRLAEELSALHIAACKETKTEHAATTSPCLTVSSVWEKQL